MKRDFYSAILLLSLTLSFPAFSQSSSESITDAHLKTGAFNGPAELPFSIYPQPSSGLINIAFTEATEAPTVQVFDLLGNRVANSKATYVSDNHFSIDLSDKKPGYYFVKIENEGRLYTRRITIRP